MNCYNSETYLAEAIRSVLSQKYQNWELIFWDNQSTDKSAAILKSFKDDRIKYYFAKEHTTLYQARNEALSCCTGKYLAILDCDDIWLPDKLQDQVAVMESDDEIVLVHCNTLFFNENTGKKYELNKHMKIEGYIFEENLKKYQFSLETVLVRLSVIIANKIDFGYRYNLIGDKDFLSTICFYGKVAYLDRVLAGWRIHDNNFSKRLYEKYPSELFEMQKRFMRRFQGGIDKRIYLIISDERYLKKALIALMRNPKEARRYILKMQRLSFIKIAIFIFSFSPVRFNLMLLNLFKRAK